MKPILSIQNLSKKYTLNTEVTACNNINLDVLQGEFLSIVGESGSGKSTLIKMLAHIEKPSHGSILFHEKNIWSFTKKELLNHRKCMQLVFQDTSSALNPKMKVVDIICEPLINFKMITKKQKKETAIQFLEQVDLDESFLDKRPNEMSGGQRQRVNIARALTLNPKVLLLDEPTSALDVITQHHILLLLKSLQEKNDLTIVFICHDLSLVTNVSDRIVVMKNGQIKEVVCPSELSKSTLNDYTKELLQATFDIKKCSCRFDDDCKHEAEYHI